jgi:hypothetical protein
LRVGGSCSEYLGKHCVESSIDRDGSRVNMRGQIVSTNPGQ